MGSLPHIRVASASSTGTHGSGDSDGNLSTVVTEFEIVTTTGDLITLNRDSAAERLNSVVLALGLLGVITVLTLRIVPTLPSDRTPRTPDQRPDVLADADSAGAADDLIRPASPGDSRSS